MKEKRPVIYLVKSPMAYTYKIGRTINLPARVSGIKSIFKEKYRPEVVPIHTISCRSKEQSVIAEKVLLKAFSETRADFEHWEQQSMTEWFWLPNDAVAHICSIKHADDMTLYWIIEAVLKSTSKGLAVLVIGDMLEEWYGGEDYDGRSCGLRQLIISEGRYELDWELSRNYGIYISDELEVKFR